MKASRKEITATETMARERGGYVGPATRESIASCKLDGETQVMGMYEFFIPGFRPTSLNKLMYAHVSERIKLKKRDTEMIGIYAHICEVPKAICRRRVSVTITLGPRQRAYDNDNVTKSLLDGLVSCGRLVNDNAIWVEMGKVTWLPKGSGEPGTMITLTDLV